MKKILWILFGLALLAQPLLAGDGWETTLKVCVRNAENKLYFGQRPDATDGLDGLYDVPALLSGDIEAYFKLEDGKYWRDVRADGAKEWTVVVKSDLDGETIRLNWKPEDMPEGASAVLMDDTAREAFDMKTGNGYEYKNDGPRQFRIRIER